MKVLAFAVAAYNLAETSRMIEIAKEAQAYFDIKFLTYGGKFEHFIIEEGFEIIRLEPELTPEKFEYLKKRLSGEVYNSTNFFNKNEIELRVKSELDIFKELEPVAVLSGWNLTVGLSARIAKVPFVNVLHSTSITEYYEAGLQSIPDNIDFKFLEKLIPKEKRTALFNKRVMTASIPVKPYNFVGEQYGLKPFKNLIEFLEGDHVFLADIPEWVNHKSLRDNVHHIGPLPARLNVPVPEKVKYISGKLPIVYFAMGSSGSGELIKGIIEGFGGKDYNVIAPIAGQVEDLDLVVPDNVVVTDFLPADKVNPMADVASYMVVKIL